MYLEDTSEHDMFDVKPVSTTAPLVMEFGKCNFSERLMILKKYFVKHTTEEGLAQSRCKDGSFHKWDGQGSLLKLCVSLVGRFYSSVWAMPSIIDSFSVYIDGSPGHRGRP